MGVDPGPADMRRAAKLAVKVVGPGVVRAGDRAAKLSRFVDKNHAAMPADIFEDIDLAFGIAHQQQRRAKEIHRPDHAGPRDVLAKSDSGPAVAKQGVPLVTEHVVIDITGVRQSVCCFDGRHYIAQVDHDGYPLHGYFSPDCRTQNPVWQACSHTASRKGIMADDIRPRRAHPSAA